MEEQHDSIATDPIDEFTRPASGTTTGRWRGTKWFLTYPRCDTQTKEDILEILSGRHDCKWIVVSEEHHRDGGLHYHVAMWLNRKLERRNRDWALLPDVEGVNIRIIWDDVGLLTYITKEDGEPACKGIDVADYIRKKKRKKNPMSGQVATMLEEGSTIDEIRKDEQFKGFVLMHHRQIQDYELLVKREKERIRIAKLKWTPLPYTVNCTQPQREICMFLNREMPKFDALGKREHRPKHLWIYGVPNTGKSWLFEEDGHLQKKRGYPIGTWNWEKGAKHLNITSESVIIGIHAYKPGQCLTLGYLEQLCDGNIIIPGPKYQPDIRLWRRPIIVVTSNFLPEQIYSERFQNGDLGYKATRSRFQVVRVTTAMNFDSEFA